MILSLLLAAAVLPAARACTTVAAARQGSAAQRSQARPPEPGWQISPEAPNHTNPLTVTGKVLEAGRRIFRSKCQRCHGPQGKGNGPDADLDHQAHMDLTNPMNAARNPDGVVFYKVWNGRERPKMPAFKTEMTENQVWTVVSYVQTLRAAVPVSSPPALGLPLF